MVQSKMLCYSKSKQSRLGEQGYNRINFVGWTLLLLYMAPGQEVGTCALFFPLPLLCNYTRKLSRETVFTASPSRETNSPLKLTSKSSL